MDEQDLFETKTESDTWVKDYRCFDHPLYTHPLTWHLWMHLVRKANHEDRKIVWNKKELVIERGCLITGREALARQTGLSPKNVRTALETLKNLGMIEKSASKSASKFSYIIICNYDKYQSKDQQNGQQNGQQAASKRPASGQQAATNKNEKNYKNEKNEKNTYGADAPVSVPEKSSLKKSVRKSTAFVPPSLEEWVAYFVEKGYCPTVAKRAYEHYAVANWHDVKGNPVRNWRQKAMVWFKPEHEIGASTTFQDRSRYPRREADNIQATFAWLNSHGSQNHAKQPETIHVATEQDGVWSSMGDGF